MRFVNPVRFAAALACVASAAAQTAPAARPASSTDDQPVKLEAFTVTGSNIRRVDAETALPVTVIEPADLEARGAATMSELFETLTMAELSGITEINNGPQLARGDVASIDLRGLGSGSTLTLINGRRMAPHPISMAEGGVPSLAANINAVPRAMISRVEILRDGASAIYGADAAAGVINNYISRDFVGRTFTVRGSMTQHGGANEIGATLADGFKAGKTHFSVSLDYFHRDALTAHDRSYSRNADLRSRAPAPWNGLPIVDPASPTGAFFARDNDMDNRNDTNQWGEWQRGTIGADFLTFTGSRPTNNIGISTSTTPPAGVATMAANGMFYLYPMPDGIYFNQTRPSSNVDNPQNFGRRSNWNKWKTLVPRTDRYQFGLFADRQLTSRMSFFGDLMFYAARSVNGREPVNAKNTDDQGIYMPAANPYNPFGVRFYDPQGRPNADGTPRLTGTPADVSLFTGISPGQNTGNGFMPRSTEVFSYSFRALAGLRGKLSDTWEWESAIMYSGAQTHEYEHFQVRESRLRAALNRTDATAFNPFPVTFKIVNNQIVVDKTYSNPASVLDPIYDDEDRFGRTELFTWDARVSGRLPWRLPFGGGNIGLATGAEVRYETYRDARAAYVGLNPPGSGSQFPLLREGDNDFLALSPNVPIKAQQTIFATYAEVALPFVTRENRKPLVQSLEVTLAARYEHFSIFGQSTKPKASLFWKPASWLKLRASIADSFRAPNLVQTNVAALKRQFSASDTYRSTVTSLPEDGSVQRTSFRQGNQDLKPEKSQTTSGGLVLDVPMVKGLSLTFDYFKVNQNSVIQNRGAAATLSEDATLLQLATQAALAAGTPIDQIDLGSGGASYKGSNAVTRAPVTAADRAAFAAYNARQTSNATRRAPVGSFVSVVDSYINLAGLDIQGYEFGAQYRTPQTRLGRFTLGGEATHYLLRRAQTNPTSRVLDQLDRSGRTKWRANANLSWRQGAWSAGWFASYFGSYADTGAETTEQIYAALGGPDYIRVFNDNGLTRYLLRVDPYIQHNAWLSYRFDRNARIGLLRDSSLRVGVNNVFDEEPPLTADQYGFRTGAANPRGRQFTMEVSKKF